MGARQPLLKGIRRNLVQDPSTDLPGFIAAELEEEEREYGGIEPIEDLAVPDKEPITQRQINVIFGSMCIGVFLASLDATVVTTLLTKIASEFNELPKISWIATSYLVSTATFQPLYGKISDIFGRRLMLLFCNLAFAFGCLLCYLSTSIEMLIVGRFISGIGGGGLTSLSSIATSDIVSLKDRGMYQGIMNINFGIGTAVGAIIGGWFAVHPEFGGWRGAFLVQVPISLVSAATIHLYLVLPKGSVGLGVEGSDIGKKLRLIDWRGALSLIVFLMLFLTSTSILGNNEITRDLLLNAKSLVTCAVMCLALVTFIHTELTTGAPILPLRFLRDPSVFGSAFANFFYCVTQFVIYYYVPVFFTTVLNMSSNDVGKRYAPNFFSIIIGSLGAGIYMKRSGRYYALLILSGVIVLLGTLKIYFTTTSIRVWEQYLLLMLPGVGLSVIITATLLALIAAVPIEHQASTTSISYLFRSCGATIGVSIGSALFSKFLDINLSKRVLKFLGQDHDLQELQDIIFRARHSAEYMHEAAPAFVKDKLIASYSDSIKVVFLFGIISSVFGFACLVIIKEYKLHASLDRA